jgi:chromate transporter
LATSWIISSANNHLERDWRLWLCTAITVVLIWKTKIHILLLLFIGAVLGGLGYL